VYDCQAELKKAIIIIIIIIIITLNHCLTHDARDENAEGTRKAKCMSHDHVSLCIIHQSFECFSCPERTL